MIKTFTNADIANIDWAKCDRSTFLRSLHSGRALHAPAVRSSGWGTDVTGNDPRSVRAFLAGKDDLRTTWWNLFSAIYLRLMPGATLERAMYSFHSRHHAVTIARLTLAISVKETAADLQREGFVAAVRNSAARLDPPR
jgi:hypothetical protein